MKKLFLNIISMMVIVTTFAQQNVGIGTTSPAASAQLDVVATNKGFLPPRVALTSTTDITTIAAPATGLLVYNTATAGTAPTNVLPGYYYYTGTAWLRIVTGGTSQGDIQYWNGSQWVILPAGTQGQTLTMCGGIPHWGPCSGFTTATVTTNATTAITATTATSGGNVTADGGAPVTARGVVYGLTANPTLANTVVAAGTAGTGSYSVNLTGLTDGVTYHVRAYATNSEGTSFGNDVSFTAGATGALPTVITRTPSSIGGTYATGNGNLVDIGGSAVTARGVVYATTINPTLANSVGTSGTNGTGNYGISLTGLTPSTLYHIRAYATNGAGTAYGDDSTFTTTAISLPAVITASPFGVSSTSANSGGNVTSNGATQILARGICYGTAADPTLANSVITDGAVTQGSYTALMTPLLPNTTYHVRAYVTNSVGTSYGGDSTFTTLATGAFAASYTFDSVKTNSGTTDPTPVPVATGVTFGSFTSVGASANPNAALRFSFTNMTLGATTGSDVFTSATDSTTKYFAVTITPGAGKTINLSSIKFTFQRSATGARQAFVRSSVDGYTANLPASVVPADADMSIVATNKFQSIDKSSPDAIPGCTITLGGASFTGISTPITFRFYGVNAESTGGSFSIDNVVFNGLVN